MSNAPRSLLFTPGARPDRFAKAVTSAAEAVILDLEDAVAEDEKDAARAHVLDFLSSRSRENVQIVVRINPMNRVCGLKDLAALAQLADGPDVILLPKAEDPSQIAAVARVLDETDSSVRIAALVESARGVAAAAELARADKRLDFLMFGAADYAADMGQQVGSFRTDFARGAIANAAAAGAIVAIDSPFFSIDQPDALRTECDESRAFGYYGKAAIHPAQLAAINDIFAPTQDELQQARRILDAAPAGVGTLDGKMVDIAMVRWAERIV